MIGVDLILGAPFLQDQNIQLVVTLRLRVTHQHQIQVRQTVFLVAFVEDFCHFCPLASTLMRFKKTSESMNRH